MRMAQYFDEPTEPTEPTETTPLLAAKTWRREMPHYYAPDVQRLAVRILAVFIEMEPQDGDVYRHKTSATEVAKWLGIEWDYDNWWRQDDDGSDSYKFGRALSFLCLGARHRTPYGKDYSDYKETSAYLISSGRGGDEFRLGCGPLGMDLGFLY
jgi:hypothetical protein